jgi:hypothetical protein
VEAAYQVTDDGRDVQVPIVEVGMPTHRCVRSGVGRLPRLYKAGYAEMLDAGHLSAPERDQEVDPVG